MAQQDERLPDPPCSESLLLCCVCGHLLDEPRLLRCLHCCCSSCLPPSSAGAADEQPVTASCLTPSSAGAAYEPQVTAQPTCPVCQETSSDVRCNGFIESRVNRYKAIAKSSLCGMCADGGEDSQRAEVWCTSCRMSICDTCLPYHRRCFKAHSTTRIEDVKSWDEVFPMPMPHCLNHNKPFSFVCFSCKTYCCGDCWPSCDKLQHDLKHVGDAAVASYFDNVQSDVDNLARTLRSKAEVLSKRKQLAVNLERDRQNDLQKLKSSKLRLLKVIDDVCVTAEARLRDTYDSLGATAEAILSSSETMEHKVDRAAKYSCYVVHEGLMPELLVQEQSLLSRMKSLCSQLDELTPPLEAGQYVAFDSTMPDDETQLLGLVTSWMGMPRAITDDLCVKETQSEILFASNSFVARRETDVDAVFTETAPQGAEDFDNYIKTNNLGLAEIMSELRRRIKECTDVPLKVAVVGNTGVGKSTFINALRRIKPSDPTAAESGANKTTKAPRHYDHSKYPNVQFWDTPGLGTPNFQRETYLQQILFDTYDFFILVCASRMTDNDVWIAQEIQRAGKNYYFLRSKIDIDVHNNESDYPYTHDERMLLNEMRDNLIEELEKTGIKNPSVFLVCKNPDLYDFRELESNVISGLLEAKCEKLLYIARTNSRDRIKQITEKLIKRSWLIAAASAGAAAIPLRGVSTALDISIFLKELAFYKEQFRLDDKGLRELSETGHASKQIIDKAKKQFWFVLTPESVKRGLDAAVGGTLAGMSLPSILISFSPFSSKLTIASVKIFLISSIASMSETSLALHEAALSKRC